LLLVFIASITLAEGRLRRWAGVGTGRGGRWAKAGRVARNAAASTGLSHNEEMLRDVGKMGQAKRC
jgi:hypothetical protein